MIIVNIAVVHICTELKQVTTDNIFERNNSKLSYAQNHLSDYQSDYSTFLLNVFS